MDKRPPVLDPESVHRRLACWIHKVPLSDGTDAPGRWEFQCHGSGVRSLIDELKIHCRGPARDPDSEAYDALLRQFSPTVELEGHAHHSKVLFALAKKYGAQTYLEVGVHNGGVSCLHGHVRALARCLRCFCARVHL